MRVGAAAALDGAPGVFSGLLLFLPIGGAELQIVPAFWMVMMGVLFIGKWPNGEPPAWAAGEARPWPSQAAAAGRRRAVAARPARTGAGAGAAAGGARASVASAARTAERDGAAAHGAVRASERQVAEWPTAGPRAFEQMEPEKMTADPTLRGRGARRGARVAAGCRAVRAAGGVSRAGAAERPRGLRAGGRGPARLVGGAGGGARLVPEVDAGCSTTTTRRSTSGSRAAR